MPKQFYFPIICTTRYNTEEKHHFAPIEILNDLFRQAQHEYDNPRKLCDAPFKAA